MPRSAEGAPVHWLHDWAQAQVEARVQMERAYERLRATMASLLDPLAVLTPVRDGEGRVVDLVWTEVNDAACSYLRADRAELVGSRVLEHFPEFGRSEVFELCVDVLETGEPLVRDDFRYERAGVAGEVPYYDLRAIRVGDELIYTWRDVSDRHAYEAQLAYLATRDQLTGLANRAALQEELERDLVADERSGRLTAVVMIDLDRFKNVNDSLGHSFGDELLRAAARRIESCDRGSDLVVRLGGDEFVVAMRDLSSGEEALRVAARICEAFRAPFTIEGRLLHSTASIGVAVSGLASDAEDLLREADTAMYHAKRHGRDQIAVFNEDLRAAAHHSFDVENRLRHALTGAALDVHFQPEVDLADGHLVGTEALLRWHQPDGTTWAAERFIDVAEETGIIVTSGAWLIERAFAQAGDWGRDHPGAPLLTRVNLSAQQLHDEGLLETVDRALKESGVDPGHLCVEITESALLRSTPTVHTNIDGIHERGLYIAIDDFGTGYASLTYLHDYPVDTIKIDRSFVSGLLGTDHSRRLVAAVIGMAHTLGMTVTAEGVETAEQAELLARLGCDSAQGYLYGRPAPAAALDPLLKAAERA